MGKITGAPERLKQKGYFGKDVTCIYLDQFAASNILDSPSNALWQKISDLLLEKSRNRQIICPVPPEHFLESANKDKESALAMDKRFAEVAQGLAFLPEVFVTANYIVSLLRGAPLNNASFCDRLARRDTLAKSGAYDLFKTKHRLLDIQITEVTACQNEIREITRQKRFSPTEMAPLLAVVKAREIKPFYDLLGELINNGGFVSKGVKFTSGDVIHWSDCVMQVLLVHHHLTIWEAVYLKDIIYRTGFDRIPSLDIRVTLTAYLAGEHKKENVNDHIDIMRLSTGLPASDILFTDKQRKFEVIQTGLAEKYGAKVFSGTNKDLEEFYEVLVGV